MEIFKIEGIILNTVDFGDANRVVTIYSKEFGKIEVNAYGCRRARSPLSGVIQMFNQICAEIKKSSQVDSIRDADILKFYPNLTADIERLSYAAIFFEIVNKMTLPKIVDIGIYNLLVNALPVINKKNPQIAALIAIAQFMEFTGFQLNFKKCVRCGKIIEGDASLSLTEGGTICKNCSHGAVKGYSYPENLRTTFETLLNFNWKSENQINFSLRQVYAAQKILFQYVQNILGQELKSIKFLRQIQG
ncbi:MAG: DNA repair protein RecO [Selenomonadaceae bacterium]|nr:DNA repair protein RecO [Selenomonadaceae bacterium]